MSDTSDRASNLSKWSLWIAIDLLILVALAPLASRWGLFDFTTAFGILGALLVAAVVLSVVALVALILGIRRQRKRDILASAHALPIALLPIVIFLFQYSQVGGVPPIHDISTDLDEPPLLTAFEGIPERSMNYEGAEAATSQRAAYADIQPISMAMPVAQAYDKALATAQQLGWEILKEDPDAGTLQAVDTTFWFGFKDDVVIRIRPTAAGSLLDIRSVSRVGISDVGKNAARIRAFRELLLK